MEVKIKIEIQAWLQISYPITPTYCECKASFESSESRTTERPSRKTIRMDTIIELCYSDQGRRSTPTIWGDANRVKITNHQPGKDIMELIECTNSRAISSPCKSMQHSHRDHMLLTRGNNKDTTGKCLGMDRNQINSRLTNSKKLNLTTAIHNRNNLSHVKFSLSKSSFIQTNQRFKQSNSVNV